MLPLFDVDNMELLYLLISLCFFSTPEPPTHAPAPGSPVIRSPTPAPATPFLAHSTPTHFPDPGSPLINSSTPAPA